jgi:hypothetical protein
MTWLNPYLLEEKLSERKPPKGHDDNIIKLEHSKSAARDALNENLKDESGSDEDDNEDSDNYLNGNGESKKHCIISKPHSSPTLSNKP